MKGSITLFFVFSLFRLGAQSVADFEQFNLPPGSFLNGSDGNGGFMNNGIFLPNDYNSQFMSWSGWAISNTTDVTTPGFTNQYSAIAGGGVNGSAHYAVTYAFGNNNLVLTGNLPGKKVSGMYVTNNTYAYFSMLDGDAFSKKFGGVTGNDPDFFRLTIRAYQNGQLSNDSVDFYLADYRFSNNSQDYIVNNWTWVDLSALGTVDSLSFSLNSSDVGQFGMNTPAYFCIDNVSVVEPLGAAPLFVPDLFQIYPNPASNFLQIDHTYGERVDCTVYDMQGKSVLRQRLEAKGGRLNIQALAPGQYLLYMQDGQVWSSKIMVKQ